MDRPSKRFAVIALHTNMQVWGLDRGYGGALRKLKRRAIMHDEAGSGGSAAVTILKANRGVK